jgi:hypothetical protein
MYTGTGSYNTISTVTGTGAHKGKITVHFCSVKEIKQVNFC